MVVSFESESENLLNLGSWRGLLAHTWSGAHAEGGGRGFRSWQRTCIRIVFMWDAHNDPVSISDMINALNYSMLHVDNPFIEVSRSRESHLNSRWAPHFKNIDVDLH